ncbi:type I-E CRISPR-associated protein Cas6/Cse3/CasE [Nocardia thailandica]|uniref:Type I-E CRISPR-associated protein Cas6/Cse3/CasE n=1 Tax=Nocardia thailandica TaxID=257275 RepID=A0ABW6PHW5_9NOCA
MFLSRVPLNPARAGTRKFLASPQAAHAAVVSSFPPDEPRTPTADRDSGRVLWRIDQRDHQVALYVVSPTEPDFTHVVEQAGWPTTTAWATRKYTPLLDRLSPGDRWHFRLTANPVKAKGGIPASSTEARRGKPHGLVRSEQLTWLQNKAHHHGFSLGACVGPDGEEVPDVIVTDRGTHRFRRHEHTVTLSTATFEGTLSVADPEALRAALVNGIGRAKGYGCGLMTLAPLP